MEQRRVAIGGVGGSGTRIFAAILREFGYSIGFRGGLNGANDNLWFSLLFRQRSVLTYEPDKFRMLYATFSDRMEGRVPTDPAVISFIRGLAASEGNKARAQGKLEKWAASFLAGGGDRPRAWGWKEPNTHVFAERLLEIDPLLHYVHVVRDAFYMSGSGNQNQVERWGDIFLGRRLENTPRDSFAFWCAVHRRVADLRARFPERVTILSHDRICAGPEAEVRRFADAISPDSGDDVIARAVALVGPPRPKAEDQPDLSATFDQADVTFARGFLASI